MNKLWITEAKEKNLTQNFNANVKSYVAGRTIGIHPVVTLSTYEQALDGRTYGRTDGRTNRRTNGRTERQKLYTPRHTSYAGGIIHFSV